MKKQNESAKQAREDNDKLIELLSIPIKKKLRKEYQRAQTAALKSHMKTGAVPSSIWVEHQFRLEAINETGYKQAAKAGIKRLYKTFVKAEWIDEGESDDYIKEVQPSINAFSYSRAVVDAGNMVKTSKSHVDWLIKKYREAEENNREFNGIADAIKKAIGEAKERSIWRSVLGATAIVQTGSQNARKLGADKVIEVKPFNIFKTWVTEKDDKVRTTHKMMEGVSVQQDIDFDVPTEGGFTEQMSYPGDPKASLANTINCRCDLIYIRGD